MREASSDTSASVMASLEQHGGGVLYLEDHPTYPWTPKTNGKIKVLSINPRKYGFITPKNEGCGSPW